MNVYFTADTHFYHENILLSRKGPFKNADEMNEKLIENWNSIVKRGDIVYHLGDFAVFRRGDEFAEGKLDYILNRLNGRIRLIVGNHDYTILKSNKCDILGNLKTIKINKKFIVLCHYPMRSWDRSHYGTFHLYGHSHNNSPPWGKSFDVGTDSNYFAPYSFEDVLIRMESL